MGSSNVDVYELMHEALRGSDWRALVQLPGPGSPPRTVTLLTARFHHRLLVVDRTTEPPTYAVLCGLGRGDDRSVATLRESFPDIRRVGVRGVPRQTTATACGAVCVYYCEVVRRWTEGIPDRWPVEQGPQRQSPRRPTVRSGRIDQIQAELLRRRQG